MDRTSANASVRAPPEASALLDIRDLAVSFDMPDGTLRAVDEVSLRLNAGETLAIVGESGSGKSTLARAVIGIVPVTAGRVLWKGAPITGLPAAVRRRLGREVQMVFQDPLAALNPRMNMGQIVAEPLATHLSELSASERRTRVGALLERVGLLPGLVNRYPHEFSCGQCQRIGIARALITGSGLLVCDEPVSALDVSVQAQGMNLLAGLPREMGLSMLFIAHDLSVVRHVSRRIAVMYPGRVMETGPAADLIARPRRPCTRALIASIPVPDPVRERARPVLEGELPPPPPPSGCVFRTRCPIARPACAQARPPLAEETPGHAVACPFHGEFPRA